MKFLKPAWLLAAIVSVATVTACADRAVVHPIGISGGTTAYRVSCKVEATCNAAMANTCTEGHYATAWKPARPMSIDFMCAQGRQTKKDETARTQAIQVLISPECKEIFYGPDFIEVDANGKSTSEKRPRPDYQSWDPARAIPMSYKDPHTSIAIYVESDGRHLAGIDAQGKLLWVRNPWEEGHVFCQYRTPRPVVSSLKPLAGLGWSTTMPPGANREHSFMVVTFDSSQFGLLDESTGDFFPEGQN